VADGAHPECCGAGEIIDDLVLPLAGGVTNIEARKA
jgi:hypothetical protein